MKKKYRCNSCNWRFARNFTPSLCPYCGKAAVVEEPIQEANNIVREVEDLGN